MKYKSRAGVTLIELVLFIGLFSMILAILLQIYAAIIDKQMEVESFSSVETDRIFILSRLSYDIQRASSIVTPSGIGVTSNTLVLQIGGQNYTYAQSSGNMTLASSTGTYNLTSFRSTITGLTFRRLGNTNGKNNVHVDFTIDSRLIDHTVDTRTVSATIGTR